MTDRYVLIETEGWLNVGVHGRSTVTPNLTVTVLDRLVAHREVIRFRSEDYGGGRNTRARCRELARQRAQALADRLNAEDAA